MLLSDEDVGIMPAPRGNGWKIDPAVQQQRDAEAERIRQGEQNGYAGFIPTSTVVPGARRPAQQQPLLGDADVGVEAAPQPAGLSLPRSRKETSDWVTGDAPEALFQAAKPVFDTLKLSFGAPLEGPAPARDPLDAERAAFAKEPQGRRSFNQTPGGAATSFTAPKGKAPRSPTELHWKALGALAQLSDMVTAIPAQIGGLQMYAGTRFMTRAAPDSAEMATMMRETFFPPEIKTPWAKVAETLGPTARRAYYENPVGWIFHKLGQVVEHGAGAAEKLDPTGRLKAADITAAVDGVMGWLGMKGTQATSKKIGPLENLGRQKPEPDARGQARPDAGEPPPRAPGPRQPQTYEGEATRVAEQQLLEAPKKQLPYLESGLAAGAVASVYAADQSDNDWAVPALTALFVPVAVKAPMTQRALFMEKRGVPREQIWQETGLFRGKDGIWRKEISDEAARLKTENFKPNQFNSKLLSGSSIFGPPIKLKDVLEHPLLSERPDIGDMPVHSTGMDLFTSGAFDAEKQKFFLSGGLPEEMQRTMLHEIQHKLQHDGGMAPGGNTSSFLPKDFDKLSGEASQAFRELHTQLEKESGVPYINQFTLSGILDDFAAGKELSKYQLDLWEKVKSAPSLAKWGEAFDLKDVFDQQAAKAGQQYRRLAGETEARAVEARMRMTAQERRQTPPWKSYDVPEEQQTVTKWAKELGLALAMKQKGGMWHPKAAEVLQEALVGDKTVVNYLRNAPENQVAQRIRDAAVAPADVAVFKWSEKAAKTYLNKHAGTETDPLKDVEIPFAEGTKPWGEVMDKLIASRPAKDHSPLTSDRYMMIDTTKVPAEEPIWNIAGEGAAERGRVETATETARAARALQGYLSHVGDFLYQNVDPAKLPQYDLVRAVKETAANDARMAKLAEKEAAESSKDLPVYKDYGDGFKWVELKLPERLTEAQGKSVRPATRQEIKEISRTSGGDFNVPVTVAELQRNPIYVAVDAQGKPITNNYTGEIASSAEPTEAYLAGQLALEGNQMGHCIGGYCEGVASGESRIFSLRDGKGKSHVTVETAKDNMISGERLTALGPRGEKAWNEYSADKEGKLRGATDYNRYQGQEHDLHTFIQKHYPDLYQQLFERPSIVQIKGKQNRAPNKEYLPYVQDFVKSGKWGEVGDLENTGLIRVKFGEQLEDLKAILQGPPESMNPSRVISTLHAIGGRPLSNPAQEAMFQAGFKTPRVPGETEVQYQQRRTQNQQEVVREQGELVRNWLENLKEGDKPGGDYVTQAEYDTIRSALGEKFSRQQGFASNDLLVRLGLASAGAAAAYYFNDSLVGAVAGAVAGGLLPSLIRKSQTERVEASHVVDNIFGLISTRLHNLGGPALRMNAVERGKKLLDRPQEIYTQTEGFWNRLNSLKGDQLLEAERKILNRGPAGFPGVGTRETQRVLDELFRQRRDWGYSVQRAGVFPRMVQDLAGFKEALTPAQRTLLQDVLNAAEAKSISKKGRGMTNTEVAFAVDDFVQLAFGEVTKELQPFYVKPQDVFHYYVREAVRDIANGEFFGPAHFSPNVHKTILSYTQALVKRGQVKPENAAETIEVLKGLFDQAESMTGVMQDVRNLTNMGLLGNVYAATTQVGDVFVPLMVHQVRDWIPGVVKTFSGNGLQLKDFGLVNHIAQEFVSDRWSAKAVQLLFKASLFTKVDAMGKKVTLNTADHALRRWAETPKGVEKLRAKYEEALDPQHFARVLDDLQHGRRTYLTDLLNFAELSDFQPITEAELPVAYKKLKDGRIFYQLHTYQLKQLDILRRRGWNEWKQGKKREATKNMLRIGAIAGLSGIAASEIKDLLSGRDDELKPEDVFFNATKNYGLSKYSLDKIEQGGREGIEEIGKILFPPLAIFGMAASTLEGKTLPIFGRFFYDRFQGGNEKAEIAEKKGTGEKLSPAAEAYRQERNDKRRERLQQKLEKQRD